MEKKTLPENDQKNCGKNTEEPVTTQPELLPLAETVGVCKECLNEDVDTCVCPEPEK